MSEGSTILQSNQKYLSAVGKDAGISMLEDKRRAFYFPRRIIESIEYLLSSPRLHSEYLIPVYSFCPIPVWLVEESQRKAHLFTQRKVFFEK